MTDQAEKRNWHLFRKIQKNVIHKVHQKDGLIPFYFSSESWTVKKRFRKLYFCRLILRWLLKLKKELKKKSSLKKLSENTDIILISIGFTKLETKAVVVTKWKKWFISNFFHKDFSDVIQFVTLVWRHHGDPQTLKACR